MYVWTDETRALMDQIRDYVLDGKIAPNAPEGTQEKWDKIKKLLNEERERQINLMFS